MAAADPNAPALPGATPHSPFGEGPPLAALVLDTQGFTAGMSTLRCLLPLLLAAPPTDAADNGALVDAWHWAVPRVGAATMLVFPGIFDHIPSPPTGAPIAFALFTSKAAGEAQEGHLDGFLAHWTDLPDGFETNPALSAADIRRHLAPAMTALWEAVQCFQWPVVIESGRRVVIGEAGHA